MIKRIGKLSRVKKALMAASMFVLAGAVTFYFISPGAEAAVTVDTSTSSSATQHSHQRKTWFDGTRYWVAFHSGSAIEFWYSATGTSWTQNTSATITTSVNDFSIEADASNAFIVYDDSTLFTFAASALSYPGTSFSWGTSTTFCNYTGCSKPYISRDSDSKVRVDYSYNTGFEEFAETRLSTSANSVSAFGAADNLLIGGGGGAGSITNSVAAVMASGEVYHIYNQDQNIRGLANRGGSLTELVSISPTNSGGNASMVGGTNDEAYISYIDGGGKNIFRKYVDKKGGNGVNINDASNGGFQHTNGTVGRSITRDSSGNIYAVIASAVDSKCHLWKSTDNGSSWSEEDSADAPTNCFDPMIAVDTTNTLHILYMEVTTGETLKYISFSSGQYGSPEGVAGVDYPSHLGIAIDSNNIPHVVYAEDGGSFNAVAYTNKIGGSWNFVYVESTASKLFANVSITISDEDAPEISYINTTDGDLTAAIGMSGTLGTGNPSNDPVSFLTHDVDTTIQTTAGTASTSISVDASGDTHIAYVNENGANDLVSTQTHTDANAWDTGWSLLSFPAGKEPSLAISDEMLYIFYTNINDDLAMISYGPAGVSYNTIATGTYQDASVRWSFNANYKHGPLDFLYSDGTDIFYSNVGLWGEPVTLDGNSGNTSTSITRQTNTGRLIVSWIRSNTLYLSVSESPYTSWSTPQAFYSSGTNAHLTSSLYSTSTTKTGVLFTNGTGSPYSVMWAVANAPPYNPTLVSPTNGATGVSPTPQLQMTTTDPESETITYTVYLLEDGFLDGLYCGESGEPVAFNQATSGTGWSNGSTPYASGATATYTVQTPLTPGATYCWTADALDSAGIDNYTGWGVSRLFTVNDTPDVPTLTTPTAGGTNVSVTPELRMYATDVDSDYLRYKIHVYSYSGACSGTMFLTIDQTLSQTGWIGQSAQSGTAYTSGQTAIYSWAEDPLAANTTYCFGIEVVDPGGSNTSSYSDYVIFTTTATAPKQEINIGGSTTIHGGTTIGN